MKPDSVPNVGRCWWLFLLYGVVALLLGVATVVWPAQSLESLAWTFGVLSLADALWSFFGLFSRDATRSKAWLLLYTVVSAVFGWMAVTQPMQMAAAMAWVVGVWLVVAGIMRIVLAFQVRKLITGEWMLVVSGVLMIVLGVMFIAMPGVGMLTSAVWLAIALMAYGIFQIALSFRLRALR